MILDGFGEGKDYAGNALTHAHMPNLQRLKSSYPSTLLKASGNAVGLPEGTQGGSEVGHFTIGAGRVVYQFLERINLSIRDGSFFTKQPLVDAVEKVKSTPGARLHLLGMISDQGVHSYLEHLFALLELAKQHNIEQIFIHAITDGRDVPERSAMQFIGQIQAKIKELGLEGSVSSDSSMPPHFNAEGGLADAVDSGVARRFVESASQSRASIATLVGRYYAMDRDHNWDRTQQAYDLYTLGKGYRALDPIQAIQAAYDRGVKTDYYLEPTLIDDSGLIRDEDTVIFWNYRTDRTRQLTQCFTGEVEIGFVPHQKEVRPFFVCFGDYSSVAPVVFPTEKVVNNLGQILSQHRLPQLRIAETEKYAHVTYFFNSQEEEPYDGEVRVLVDSPKVPSYAQKPEMSAYAITEKVIEEMEKQDYALIVQNFANSDLVGHSGNMEAAVKACEVMDECIGRIAEKALEKGYHLIITADHGNAEYMLYENNGEPCPSHTVNPVICVLVSLDYKDVRLRQGKGLQDVAPTVLDIMELKKTEEMTGESLIER